MNKIIYKKIIFVLIVIFLPPIIFLVYRNLNLFKNYIKTEVVFIFSIIQSLWITYILLKENK